MDSHSTIGSNFDSEKLLKDFFPNTLGEVGQKCLLDFTQKFTTVDPPLFTGMVLRSNFTKEATIIFLQLDIELDKKVIMAGIRLNKLQQTILRLNYYSRFQKALAEKSKDAAYLDKSSTILGLAYLLSSIGNALCEGKAHNQVKTSADVQFIRIKKELEKLTVEGLDSYIPENMSPLMEFLAKNHHKLAVDSKGDGYGSRLFVGYGHAAGELFGPVLEENAERVIKKYAVDQDLFEAIELDEKFIRDLIFIHFQIEAEVLSTSAKVGLKLNEKELSNLKSAYNFALTSRLNGKSDTLTPINNHKKFSAKEFVCRKNTILGIVTLCSHVAKGLAESKSEEDVVCKLQDQFFIQRKMLFPNRPLTRTRSKSHDNLSRSIGDFFALDKTPSSSNLKKSDNGLKQ